MERDLFESQMKELLYRRPFVPFEVEKEDGETILVDRQFAMGGGMVAFISAEHGLTEIPHEKVKVIRPFVSETAQ